MSHHWMDAGEAMRELDISTDDVGKQIARHCARRPPRAAEEGFTWTQKYIARTHRTKFYQ